MGGCAPLTRSTTFDPECSFQFIDHIPIPAFLFVAKNARVRRTPGTGACRVFAMRRQDNKSQAHAIAANLSAGQPSLPRPVISQRPNTVAAKLSDASRRAASRR